MTSQGSPRQSQRARQKERTRQKLLDATMEVVTAEGLSGTTMGKVARKAGLSQGIVNFHFESKEQLLCDTLSTLAHEYQSIWQAAIAQAGDDPAAQLEALVRALFHPNVAEHIRLACWFAFWGDAYARGIYRRIGSRVDEKTAVAIEGLCVRLVGDDPADAHPAEVAKNLVAMVTGHWLMTLLRPQDVNLQRATRSCLTYLRDAFPQRFTLPEKIGRPAEVGNLQR